MKHYKLRPDKYYAISECLARPIHGDITLSRDGATNKYKIGDLVLLSIEPSGEFRFELMTKKEFDKLFVATPEQEHTATSLPGRIASRFGQRKIDPFRPNNTKPLPPDRKSVQSKLEPATDFSDTVDKDVVDADFDQDDIVLVEQETEAPKPAKLAASKVRLRGVRPRGSWRGKDEQ